MIQLYLLSLAYLLIGAGLILVRRYDGGLMFLVDMKASLRKNRLGQLVLVLAGIVISAGLLFMPMPPGPAILGDLIPAIAVLLLAVHYLSSATGNGLRGKLRALLSQTEFEKARIPVEESQRILAETIGLESDGTARHQKARRLLGWFCLAVAALHFFFPAFVLI